MTEPVRIVFLGGLGEIGRNCFCLEVDDRILVVDCGLMFPDADMPGVDLVLPDFTYLREKFGELGVIQFEDWVDTGSEYDDFALGAEAPSPAPAA